MNCPNFAATFFDYFLCRRKIFCACDCECVEYVVFAGRDGVSVFLINDKYEIKQVVANSVPRQIKIVVTGNKMYRSFV